MSKRLICTTCVGLATLVTIGRSEATVVVDLNTNFGLIQLELYDDTQPLTVANFLNYANSGRYDGTFFHRAVPGFVLQGGGFASPQTVQVYSSSNPMLGPDGNADTSGWANYALTATAVATDAPVQNEPGRSNVRGTVAMAKVGGDPNSATNQFFFNLADNSANLDAQNGGFTVFGQVLQGMNIVDFFANPYAVEIGNLAGDEINNTTHDSTPDGWRDPVGTFSEVPLYWPNSKGPPYILAINSVTVPEPVGFVVMGLGGLALLRLRGRKPE